MAIRFDNAADLLARTAGVPAFGDLTRMCWLYRITDNTNNEIVFIIGDSSTYNQYIGYYLSTAAVPRIQAQLTGGSAFSDGTGALSLTTWYHLAGVFNLTAETYTLYVNGVLNVSAPLIGTATWGLERIGNGASAAVNWVNGRFAAWKAWTAALTVEEIRTEMRCMVPVRGSNLHSWHPWLTHTPLNDYGQAWTASGTLTTENGPPLPWSVRQPVMPRVSAAVVSPASTAPPPRVPRWRFARSAA